MNKLIPEAVVEAAARAVEKATTATSYGWSDEQFETWWTSDPEFVQTPHVWSDFRGTRKERRLWETRIALTAAQQQGQADLSKLPGSPAYPDARTDPFNALLTKPQPMQQGGGEVDKAIEDAYRYGTGALKVEHVSHEEFTAPPSVTEAQPVGEAGTMPGTNGGFTTAVFKAADVPVGTKLYTAPTSAPMEGELEALREFFDAFMTDNATGPSQRRLRTARERVEALALQPAAVDGAMTPTGTFCSVCEAPQHNTPSGVSCSNGHGGMPALAQQPATVECDCPSGRVDHASWCAVSKAQDTALATQPAACVGCEGKPSGENNPCRVCGSAYFTSQQPAAVDELQIDRALAERVMDALGRFTSDEGWSAEDMMTADAFGAALATQHQEPTT